MVSSEWLNSSIFPVDGILVGTTTPVQSGTRSNGNERVIHVPKSFRTGALSSLQGGLIYLKSYLTHSWEIRGFII